MSIHDNARALAKGKRPVIFSEDLAMKLINELDVDRLEEAIHSVERPSVLRFDCTVCRPKAEAIAREYARLGEDES